MANGVTAPVLDMQQWVKKQSHVHVDETPWAVKGIKEWLWVAANKLFCLFHAGDTRSRAELEKISRCKLSVDEREKKLVRVSNNANYSQLGLGRFV